MIRITISPDTMQSQELLALLDLSMANSRRMAFRYFQSPRDAHKLIHETRERALKFISNGENNGELAQASTMGCWLFTIMHEIAQSNMPRVDPEA